MIKKKQDLNLVVLRYLIILIIGLLSLKIFYYFFLPLTTYPVKFLLSFIYRVNLFEDVIVANGFPIEIIGACVAGSAYLFLLILNLSTPNIGIKKRFLALITSFAIFLILNVMRIFLLSIMFISGSPFFNFAHKFLWYLGSSIFVVGIWFLEIKLFKIKAIPFYSDLKSLYKESFFKKN